jgi:hypothetical protein
MQRLQSDADTRHHLGPTRIVMTALAAYDATRRAVGNEIAAYGPRFGCHLSKFSRWKISVSWSAEGPLLARSGHMPNW